MFKTRLISGIVLVVAALLFILAGGKILWAVMAAISENEIVTRAA